MRCHYILHNNNQQNDTSHEVFEVTLTVLWYDWLSRHPLGVFFWCHAAAGLEPLTADALLIKLCHPLYGSKSQKYELLRFLTTAISLTKSRMLVAFNRDTYWHLGLSSWLIISLTNKWVNVTISSEVKSSTWPKIRSSFGRFHYHFTLVKYSLKKIAATYIAMARFSLICNGWVTPVNTHWAGRLSTVDLFIKVACFVTR
jgi:hypothetical protein